MNDRVSCYTTKEIVHNKNHKNNDDIYETHQETCGIVWKCNFDPQCIVNASGWKMNKDNYFKRPGTLMLFYHSRAHNRKNWVPSILTHNVWLIFMGMKQKKIKMADSKNWVFQNRQFSKNFCEKGYLSNLLVRWLLPRFYVFWDRDLKFWLQLCLFEPVKSTGSDFT